MGWLKKNITLTPYMEILFDTDKVEKDANGNVPITVAYRRVSTDKQAESGFGLEVQRDKIIQYCKMNDIKLCLLLTDDGYTGTDMNRPAIQHFISMINDFNLGYSKIKVNLFIIPRLDRLARSLLSTLQFIQDYIVCAKDAVKTSKINTNKEDIYFVSINEPECRVDNPVSKMMLSIFATLAEYDRDMIVQKLKAGKEKRLALGYPMGGGNIPYGYRYIRDKDGYGNYETESEEKAKFLEARRLFVEEHLPPAKIKDMLGFSSEQHVIAMLKRRTYLNVVGYLDDNGNWIEYPAHFEAFITEEEWQEQMDEFEKRAKGRSDSIYLLTSLVYCGNCGAKMRYQKERTGVLKLICYSQEKSASKRHLVKDDNCPNHTRYYAEDVEKAVLQEIFKLSYLNKSDNKSTVSDFDVVAHLEKEMASKQAELKRLFIRSAKLDPDSLQFALLEETINEKSAEIDRLNASLQDAKKRKTVVYKANRIRKQISTFSESWEYMTQKERKDICRELIDKVIITETGGTPNLEVHIHLEQYLKKQ